MEDALLPPVAVQQIKPNKFLVLGIAASVILHLACVFVLLGLPSGVPEPAPAVTYVDLNAAQHPAPMAVPPKDAVPPKLALEPQTPQVPETPPQPPLVQQPLVTPVQPASPPVTKVEEQRSQTVLGQGLTKGYFKALGDGATLRESVKGYYQDMLQNINEKWWIDQQIDKRHLKPVVVSVTVARNGNIIGCEIMRGSGSPRYDKAVLAALAAASPLPPLPENYELDFFQVPIRLVPPLNLMAW
jgi:periplasmic protein TonB